MTIRWMCVLGNRMGATPYCELPYAYCRLHNCG